MKRKPYTRRIALAAAVCAFSIGRWASPAIAADAPAHSVLRGAGATFPAPLYSAWGAAWRRTSGVELKYEPAGSGAGIERVRSRRVDFGATDAPLDARALEEMGLMQFPVVIGGVVPVFNISGIAPGRLRLDGALLGDIYLCAVRKWNDPRIAALNPGLKLPDVNITVVHRGDASGSSALWTDYLARSNAEWRSRIGTSLAPAWPCGTAGTGNEGVASYVQRTRFALGYVEFYFAREHRLSDASLRNRDGIFIQASRTAFAAAAAAGRESLGTPSGWRQLATDSPGEGSWPITGASFVLVSTAPENAAQTRAVRRFFAAGLSASAAEISRLSYTALPEGIRSSVMHLLETAP